MRGSVYESMTLKLPEAARARVAKAKKPSDAPQTTARDAASLDRRTERRVTASAFIGSKETDIVGTRDGAENGLQRPGSDRFLMIDQTRYQVYC